MDGEGAETAPKQEMRFNMRVDDARQSKDAAQQFALSERLKADNVDLALFQAHKFLGEYSGSEPQDLSIQLVDGKIGEGTIKGKVIEIQLPGREQAISETRGFIEPLLKDIKDENKDKVAEELATALTASTALHEGVHGMLDSRPGSKFASDFEAVTGFPNEQGRASTLLDEGIAYAVQGIYAPDVEPIGSLTPVAGETDERELRQRKVLGEKLRPVVKEYIDADKSIDADFFETAKEAIIDVQTTEAEKQETEKEVLKIAERIVLTPIPIITDKSNSPSEDKRDFVSLSPYWHLDEGGKPIQKDTVINPDIESYQDPKKLQTVKNAIYICSLAADATEDASQREKYLDYAVSAIKTWFINGETRMTPSLEFAQIKQGEENGNFYGIIDGAGLVQVVEGISNLSDAGLIDEETLDGAKKWFGQYLNWLLTSEKGIGKKNAENAKERGGEKAMPNNHGTFYDAQVAYIADFLGKEEIVQGAIQSTKERIKTQITPDGEMPEETKRGDMSLDYQVFNLFALSEMAAIAKKHGVDLWGYETEDGRGIKKAFEYVNGQLESKDKTSFRYNRAGELYYSFRAASQAYGIDGYWDLPQRIYNDPLSNEVSAKLFGRV